MCHTCFVVRGRERFCSAMFCEVFPLPPPISHSHGLWKMDELDARDDLFYDLTWAEDGKAFLLP